MKFLVAAFLFFGGPAIVVAQSNNRLFQGSWRGELHRKDDKLVVFAFDLKKTGTQWSIVIRNDKERIPLKNVQVKGDSVSFEMPVFESAFKTVLQPDGSLRGIWYKGTAQQTQQWLFTAMPGRNSRFDNIDGKAAVNVSGRWMLSISRPPDTQTRPAIAEWKQTGQYLSGTILAPSGDYRYLEGTVTGNRFFLSTFDGAHAYRFEGYVGKEGNIDSAWFFSGYAGVEVFTGFRDANAKLPDVGNVPVLKEGRQSISFSGKDLEGKMVYSADPRFSGKVVVVQLMGSWCPNCMDETRFLSDFYKKNHQRGIEMVALAYENSTDFERSKRSVEKFRERYAVDYPMLITGVWVNDSLRTEKTIPEITPIKAFPTTIFIGKDGKVKHIETGFSGPGTGPYYDLYRKAFIARIERLLAE